MASYISTEIVGIIVDLLRDDKPTLVKCALVSCAWLPRSRYNLFRSITYHVKSDGSGFVPFLDFLQSSPQLANLIRELTLDGLVEIIDSPREGSQRHEILSYSTLFDILGSLPTLSHFGLRHVSFPQQLSWMDEEHQRFAIGIKRELALCRLALHSIGPQYSRGSYRCGTTTVSEIQSVLGIFSSVQELRISSLFIISDPDNSQTRPRNPLYGQTQPFSLVITSRQYPDEFWDALNRISVPLRSLCLVGCDFKLVKEFKNFTTGLKHLRLNFSNLWAFSKSDLIQLNLSDCAALISFTLWAAYATPYAAISWTQITSFIQNLPLGVQRITICICCIRGCDVDFLDSDFNEPSGWEQMRRWLNRLSNLTDLSFVVHHKDSESSVSDPKNKVFDTRLRTRLEKELSLLHEQGILSISSSAVAQFGPED